MATKQAGALRLRFSGGLLMLAPGALLGALLTASVNSFAMGDVETMLMKLKSGDFEGIRNYLLIKADDVERRDERVAKRLETLEKQLQDLQKQTAELKKNHTVKAPFTVVNESGKPLMQVIADRDGGMLRMLAKDGAITSSALIANAAGGTVLVNNSAGQPIAGMAAMSEGGKVIVTGPEGGKTLVSMGIVDKAGLVSIFSPGSGAPLVDLSGRNNEGAFTAYSKSGYATAKLQAAGEGGNGTLELSSGADGQIMVQAGTAKSQVGMVRVGPSSRGPAAVAGGMQVASEIVGSRGK